MPPVSTRRTWAHDAHPAAERSKKETKETGCGPRFVKLQDIRMAEVAHQFDLPEPQTRHAKAIASLNTCEILSGVGRPPQHQKVVKDPAPEEFSGACSDPRQHKLIRSGELALASPPRFAPSWHLGRKQQHLPCCRHVPKICHQLFCHSCRPIQKRHCLTGDGQFDCPTPRLGWTQPGHKIAVHEGFRSRREKLRRLDKRM